MFTTANKRQHSEIKETQVDLALTPYSSGHEHLLDELRWLNRLLAAHVMRLRKVDFYDGMKNFHDFFIADEEIDALLAAGVFEADSVKSDDKREKLVTKLLAQAQNLRQNIHRRVQEALAQNIHLPLVHLARSFHLSEFEQHTLLICLAPQIDARYEKLYAYLQNDLAKKFPSIDLILGLFAPTLEERLPFRSCFHPAAPLRYYNLIENLESEAGTSAAQYFLRVDAQVLQYILGSPLVDTRLQSHLRFLSPLDWDKVVVSDKIRVRLLKLIETGMSAESNLQPVLYFSGREGVGKKTLARALCSEVGVPLAVVDVRSLLRETESFAKTVRLILRHGMLQPCAVYFDHLEKLENAESESMPFFSMLAHEIHALGWLTFLGSEHPMPTDLLDLPRIYAVKIPASDYAGQKALWEMYLEGVLSKNDWPHLDELTARFDLTGGQIAHAVRRAQQEAIVRDAENVQATLGDLFASSRVQSRPNLSTLTRKITPKYQWSELVLPEDQLQQLHELANQVQHRQKVMGEWGFAKKLSLGHGINALFAGPSGTGKTMAAEVIAHYLGLDLYKIDLSAVVSKYIGETEKNLSRIFTEAEHSNVILFFDEADALFGRRSEVRDAHDRYANIEIAYLLQKMEEYEGITILSTNMRQNIDEAFLRRIRFIIEFPFPNEEYRLRIWQGIWPVPTPVDAQVDLDFMARQFKLTGGNIRNIALSAAFLAAKDGRMVTMQHLLRATRREFQKMGKLVSESEFGKYDNRVSHE